MSILGVAGALMAISPIYIRKAMDMADYRRGVKEAYVRAGVEMPKLPKLLTLKRSLGYVGAAIVASYDKRYRGGESRVSADERKMLANGIIRAFESQMSINPGYEGNENFIGSSLKELGTFRDDLQRKGYERALELTSRRLTHSFGGLSSKLTGERYKQAIDAAYEAAGLRSRRISPVMSMGGAIRHLRTLVNTTYEKQRRSGKSPEEVQSRVDSIFDTFASRADVDIVTASKGAPKWRKEYTKRPA